MRFQRLLMLIVSYLGTETTVTVPAELDGQAVRTVAAGAFEGVSCRIFKENISRSHECHISKVSG